MVVLDEDLDAWLDAHSAVDTVRGLLTSAEEGVFEVRGDRSPSGEEEPDGQEANTRALSATASS